MNALATFGAAGVKLQKGSRMSPLQVEVLHNEITVTLPGTSYTVTYYRPKYSRILLAKRQSSKDDQRTNVTLSEFLGSAWWAANDKARELGWIV
jgi:hypothetical protein